MNRGQAKIDALKGTSKTTAARAQPPESGMHDRNGKLPAESTAPAIESAAPRKPPENFDAYYESGKGYFWSRNGKGQWQKFTTDELACMLKNRNYSSRPYPGETASEVERFLHSMRFHSCIDWAGELAGWEVGRHEIAGLDVLITRGRKPVEARQGKFDLIRTFLKSLLGKEQTPFFLGWLKGSLEALREGYPFRPGQLVAFSGDVNCGKSFAQVLVTHILGGRQGDPTDFLLGETKFTADFFQAEHLFIEDRALKDFSKAKRRAFSANLKALVVNQEQKVHPKGKEAKLLPVGTRITLSCNDAKESIAVLPTVDRDVRDKFLYFLCSEGTLPMRKSPTLTRREQLEWFLAEIPAFVHWLERWKIPEDVKDPSNRFTVRAFQHPAILEHLDHLEPEFRLLQLFQVLDLKRPPDGPFIGTAEKVEGWMRDADSSHQLDKIISTFSSMGMLLSKLARDGDERIAIVGRKGTANLYRIDLDEF